MVYPGKTNPVGFLSNDREILFLEFLFPFSLVFLSCNFFFLCIAAALSYRIPFHRVPKLGPYWILIIK